jgi:hypothetical protein
MPTRDTPSAENVAAKAARRFAKADRQRAAIKDDPKTEVARAKGRIEDAKKEKITPG